jgi:hypothetical protein
MYLTITQNPNPIYNGIDNNSGQLYIGLCKISYSVKGINISSKLFNNTIKIGGEGVGEKIETVKLQEGYYNFHTFANTVLKPINITAKLNHETSLVTLIIPAGKVVAMSINLATTLGFENNRLKGGTHTGENPMKRFDLYLHLNELNTTENLLNGKPSSLLEIISTNSLTYCTKEYATPRFKQLSKGFFENLNFSIKNEYGHPVEGNELYLVLKIITLPS